MPPVDQPLRTRAQQIRKGKKRKPPPRPSRPSPAFGPLSAQTQPFRQAQKDAAKKTRRAQARLPEHAVPHIPVIANPTPKQQQAAKRTIIRHVNQRAGRGKTNTETLARRGAALRDLATSKAGRKFLNTGRYYAQVEAETPVYRQAAARNLRDRVAPGKPHRRIGVPGVASIDTTVLGRRLAAHLASGGAGAAGARVVSGVPKIAKNAGADVFNFPRNAIIGGVEIAKVANDLAGYLPASPQKGKSKRAKRLAKGFTEGALGQLVYHGDPKAAGKAFAEHPVYSALEFTGVGQVVGRTAGAASRAGVVGKAAKARAQTPRAPLRYGPGREQTKARSYSPNLIVQEAQRAADRSRKRRGHDPNVARGRRQSRLLNQQVDEFAGQAEGTRRRGREETTRVAAKLRPVRRGRPREEPKPSRRRRTAAAADRGTQRAAEGTALPGRLGRGRPEADVVLAAVEGRLHGPATFKRDVTRERDRLQRVYVEERATMGAAARQANREQVKALDRVLGDSKALANADEVFRAARDYKAQGGQVQKELIAQNVLDPDQALAAQVRPYAVSQMGARHDPTLRAPEHMATRHDEARQIEAELKGELKRAGERVARLAAQRNRAIGSHRTARAHEGGPHAVYYVGTRRFESRKAAVEHAKETKGTVKRVSLSKPEARRSGELARLDSAISAARQDRRAVQARYRQAQRDRVSSSPKKYATGLVDENGKKLSTAEIVEHMRANPDHGGGTGKLDLPGFVSHRRDTTGAKAHFVNWFDRRQTVDAKSRTGEATRTGSHAAGFRALEEHLVRGQGVVDSIKSFDDFVRQIGVKRSDGKHYTWAQAERVAGDMEDAYGVEMVPLRVAPARYDAATRQQILERQGTADSPQELESLVLRRLDEALNQPAKGSSTVENVVLVPAEQLKRFREHQATSSNVGAKAGQAVSRAFRGTVLPFSTKWLFGNAAEALLRSGLHGITPADVARGGAVMRELRKLDEEKFKDMDTRTRGGLLYGSGDRLDVHREARDFENTALETPAKVLAQTARLPVIRQVLGAVKAYQRAVFALNRGMETAYQTGVIGKQARKDVRELTGSWGKAVRMQRDVAKEVASGLLETPKQVQYARYIDEVLGKYSRFSPTTRRAIQTYAPFLPWYLNSARFVLYTLPAKHPAKTALLANVETTLQKDIEQLREDAPPGDLESAVRTKDGGYLPLARYTPFGAWTNLPEGAIDPLLPQISSFGQIIAGRSWTGKPLKLESGEQGTEIPGEKRAAMAFYALLEGFVPGVSIARRAQESGETAMDESTVLSPKTKRGSSYGTSALRRIIDPLRPTYLSPPGSTTAAKPPSAKVLRALGIDPRELRQATRESAAGLDEADLEELRRAARAAP